MAQHRNIFQQQNIFVERSCYPKEPSFTEHSLFILTQLLHILRSSQPSIPKTLTYTISIFSVCFQKYFPYYSSINAVNKNKPAMVSSTLSLAWPRTGPMVASRRRRISLPRLDSFMVRGGVALAGPPPGSTAWAPSPSPLCDTLLTSCSGFYIRGSKCPNKTVRLNKLHLLGRSDMKAHRCP